MCGRRVDARIARVAHVAFDASLTLNEALSSARRRVGEAIADATDGLDVFACFAELLAQSLHVRVDGARRDVGVDTPDVAQERAARLHAVAAIVERREELELERGELHLFVVNPNAVCVAVDAQAAEVERRRGGLLA